MDFYFDFSSPYAYFAAHQIDAIAARFGRSVAWHPIMIGSAFKASGNKPLIEQPLKGAYSVHDWARMARLSGLPWAMPASFPMAALAPSRLYWYLAEERPDLARPFALAVFDAYFAKGRDPSRLEVTAEIAAGLGLPAELVPDICGAPHWKQKLKDETDAAIARGVFGSPFFILDGESFWGADRLWMVERWLETGGW